MSDKAKKAKLEAIRKRMADPKHSKGGSSDYWKPESGESYIIRLLPDIGDMDMIWQQKGSHYLKDTKTYLACLSFTTDGAEDCPLCEYSEAAKAEGNMDLYKYWKVDRSYLYNIIIRDKDASNGFIGPKIYNSRVTVFGFFTSLIASPDYGAIWDVEKGRDLRLKKEDTDGFPLYEVLPRGDSSPLLGTPGEPDHEAIEELLSKARDHSKILNGLPSYDELVEESGLSAYFDDPSGAGEDDFEDDDL